MRLIFYHIFFSFTIIFFYNEFHILFFSTKNLFLRMVQDTIFYKIFILINIQSGSKFNPVIFKIVSIKKNVSNKT